MIHWIVFLFVWSIIFPAPAHAYLDPGSGSMVLQLLLAGFAGAAVGFKVFWRRLVAYFGRSKNRRPPSSPL